MSSSHGRRGTSASEAAPVPEGGRQQQRRQQQQQQQQRQQPRPTSPREAAPRPTTADSSAPQGPPSPHEFTPITLFNRGTFAGKYMSFCLQVAQEPVAGRRKTDKDRRPIAPTPIIRLWIREHAGATGLGVFVNPSDINISTLVCAVDLVQPNSPPTDHYTRSGPSHRSTGSPSPTRARLSTMYKAGPAVAGRSESTSLSPRAGPVGHGISGPISMWQGLSASGAGGVELSHAESSRHGAGLKVTPIPRPHSPQSHSSQEFREDETSSEDEGSPAMASGGAVCSRPASGSRPTSGGSEASRGGARAGRGRFATIGDSIQPGRGRAKAFDKSHRNLHGRLHVEANRVIDMEGEMGLWFLFMSLSVRNEGTYSLYFRCFDRSATTKGMPPAPSLAACRSMDFKVFSPRNYHGRPPKTLLADHFNRQGFKLNTRKVQFPLDPDPIRFSCSQDLGDMAKHSTPQLNERQVASPSPPPE